MIAAALLTAMLLAAVCSILAARRVPNPLVAWGALAALAISAAPGGIGFAHALAGFFLGLLALLPLHALRAVGAGDLRLMAAVGAFVGPQDLPLTVLATLIAGGLMSALATLRRGMALAPSLKLAGKMPYALAIAAGAWSELALRGSSLAAWLRP